MGKRQTCSSAPHPHYRRLARTEAVQPAIIGFVLLGDSISPWATAAIQVSLVGVVLIAGKPAQTDARSIGMAFSATGILVLVLT